MGLIEDSTKSLKELKYIILASGSDNRAYKVLSKLKFKKNINVIFFHFKERLNNLQDNDSLFEYKNFVNKNSQEIYCEIINPSSCLEEITKNNFNKKTKIGIDISCFTKPYFFFIIKLLKERFSVGNIYVFYTEPKSYLFPKGLFKSFHSCSGPLSIEEIQGYSGFESRGAKRKLVILLGFDGDLSKEINEDISPNNTIVVNGFPSYIPKFKDISLIANEKHVSDHNIEVCYARANNPFEVYNLLQAIKDNDGEDTFINIAPLGTKPMALGACLFALHNPNVRIVYPMPENYKNKYSDKSWNSWIYDLPLNN
jgi:hypothetical protein